MANETERAIELIRRHAKSDDGSGKKGWGRQKLVAADLGVSEGYISRIINGKQEPGKKLTRHTLRTYSFDTPVHAPDKPVAPETKASDGIARMQGRAMQTPSELPRHGGMRRSPQHEQTRAHVQGESLHVSNDASQARALEIKKQQRVRKALIRIARDLHGALVDIGALAEAERLIRPKP